MTPYEFVVEVACSILTHARHCGASWCVAYNGSGPHALGITEGRKPNVNLSADDAIRLAREYEACGSSPSP